MRLRWKKSPLPTGLSRIGSGPPSSTLRIDGKTRVAMVSTNNGGAGWYWVAGWEGQDLGIPHCNTCSTPVQTEQEAKCAAMAYVREHLGETT